MQCILSHVEEKSVLFLNLSLSVYMVILPHSLVGQEEGQIFGSFLFRLFGQCDLNDGLWGMQRRDG